MVMLAVCTACMVSFDETDGFSNISGEDSIVKVDTDFDVDVIYNNHDYDDRTGVDYDISYEAVVLDNRGNEVDVSISPDSGDLYNGIASTLTVTAPKDAGDYTLQVTITPVITYMDGEEQQTVKPDPDIRTYGFKAVEAITLTVSLSSTGDIDLAGFGVYFYVDGQRMDDSYKTVDLSGTGTADVSYEWIADASVGAHEFYVAPANGNDGSILVQVEGLGDVHTFYVGDNDYAAFTALIVVVLILLIVILVWVYRKPVKNYGKPKSRR